MGHYDLSSLTPEETIGHMPDYHFPPYVTLAHMFHAPAGWEIRNRTMSQFVLQYVVEGYAAYPIAGNEYETRRGDLLFHRPGELHSIATAEGEPYVCISLVFHFGTAPFPYEELFQGRHLLGNFADQPAEAMLSQLVEHYKQPGPASQLRCQSLLLGIFAEAAHRLQTTSPAAKANALSMPKLVLIKNHLTDHYADDIRISELERVSGLSKNYILALFREHVGMSPMQYLTWVRIRKARELALLTSLSIGEIARLVGYSDVHTFGRMYKKKTGQSFSRFCSNLIYS